MSRTDDFAKAGQALAETKRTSEAQAQCRYDFDIAAEHGYQYAVDKAMVVLRDDLFMSDDKIELFRQAMEV